MDRRWLLRVFQRKKEFAIPAIHMESFETEEAANKRMKELKKLFPNYDMDVILGWRPRILEPSNAAFLQNMVKNSKGWRPFDFVNEKKVV